MKGTQYNIRLDSSFRGDRDRVYGNYFKVDQNSQYIDPRPAFSGTTPGNAWYVGLGYTHVFSSTIINQLNVGYNRIYGGTAVNPNYSIFPHMTIFCFTCNGFPVIGGPQESPGTPYFGTSNKGHTYALRDYVSWLKGKHSVRLGFQFQDVDFWTAAANDLSRPYNTYFSDLFEMLQGKADEASLYTISAQTGKWQPQTYGAKETQYGIYAQDDWKVTPNFLLSLGLRWDDFGNPTKFGYEGFAILAIVPGCGFQLVLKVQRCRIADRHKRLRRRPERQFCAESGVLLGSARKP